MNKETEQMLAELERIVVERQDWLFRFAYMRIGIREDAEDVVQEVLLSVFRRLREKTSLIGKAANLKGKLQIITGYNDNTVVPQHCLSFLDACIKADTQPDFFAYPGEEHNMRGHASVHLHERITQYFEDYLK